MWHGIGSMWHLGKAYDMPHMCHVACLMSCLGTMWDGLDLASASHGVGLTYVACHMPCLDAT
jgi:hypothetical protein